MFGVAVVLLPVAEQRASSAAGHALAEADAAFELDTSWRSLEAIHDTWMNLENPGTLPRHSGRCVILIVLKFAAASFVVVKTC